MPSNRIPTAHSLPYGGLHDRHTLLPETPSRWMETAFPWTETHSVGHRPLPGQRPFPLDTDPVSWIETPFPLDRDPIPLNRDRDPFPLARDTQV